MANTDRLFTFTTEMTGQQRVEKMFAVSIEAFGAVLDKNKITKLILQNTQARFDPQGSNHHAQRSPLTGQFWAKLNDKTRRVKNKNKGHKLFDKGKLRSAIVVARDNLRNAFRSGTGAAEIAVIRKINRQTNKNGAIRTKYTDVYGEVHQKGNSNTPARAFMGISKRDAAEVDVLMTATFNRFIANFG